MKKIFTFSLVVIIGVANLMAQDTLYIFKSGVVEKHLIADIDSITFVLPQEEEEGTVTDIDGNIYQTVVIGNQVWMAENLKTTTYSDGTPIPNITDNVDWGSLTSGAFCYFDNDPNKGDIYGALYNWFTLNDERGLCPSGWHVPTEEEMNELEGFADSFYEIGDPVWEEVTLRGTDQWIKLKATEGWEISEGNVGTDEFGFGFLPGGYRGTDGVFNNSFGYLWTSTEASEDRGFRRRVRFDRGGANKNARDKQEGLSVRCIRD